MTTEPSQPLAAPGQDGRHLYTCPLCEAMCGLQIEVADEVIDGSISSRLTAARAGLPD